jgi:hypothetical protein
VVPPSSRQRSTSQWCVALPVSTSSQHSACLTRRADLEIYTTRTDAYGLITLAALLLVLCDAVPLPKALVGAAFTEPASEKVKKPYARAMILITMFHHITTGIGSYQHWVRPSHHTIAMDIGVYGNIGLTALGIAALVYGLDDSDQKQKVK